MSVIGNAFKLVIPSVVTISKPVIKAATTLAINPPIPTNDNWQTGIDQLKNSGKAGRGFASFFEGSVETAKNLVQTTRNMISNPPAFMGEMLDNRIEAIKKNPLLLDPIQYSFYQVNTFKNSEYNAFVDKKKEVGFWNALSYQLGKATTNVAAIGVSREIGNGIGGMFPSGGISMKFTKPPFATANGAMMTAAQISVSKSNILLAANMMGGGLAAQGVMYSTSQSNKNSSNKNTGTSSNNASSDSSKTTSQGSSSGGGELNSQIPENTGRGKNNIKPDTNAQGSHSVYKYDPNTGKITNYKTYEPNPKNPSGFDEIIGYDGVGKPHVNKATGESLMPHVHDKTVPGGVREPYPYEIPK